MSREMTRDEFICKKLGWCWHETGGASVQEGKRLFRQCRKCKKIIRDEDGWFGNDDRPDFSTWTGFGRLWEAMRRHKSFWPMVFVYNRKYGTGLMGSMILPSMINPTVFADAVYQFFGGEGNEHGADRLN